MGHIWLLFDLMCELIAGLGKKRLYLLHREILIDFECVFSIDG